MTNPAWLAVLSKAGILDPPENQQSPWPALAAVLRLAPDYPDELAAWLKEAYEVHGAKRKPAAAWCIANAALEVGGPALGVVLSAATDHPKDSNILFLGYEAPEMVNPSSEFVESIADVVLNADHRDVSPSDEWQVERLVGRLLEGMNEANADRRVLLLRRKLHAVSEDDYNRGRLERDRAGSIADKDDASRSDWFSILLAGLVEALDKARKWKPTVELLTHLEGLPASLVQRLRAWILGGASDVNVDMLVAEIERAISSRLPTGDDLALIDRVLRECDAASYSTRWCEALGTAPGVEDVGRALSSSDVPPEWLRTLGWVSLLPSEAVGSWATPCKILSAKYGGHARENLEHRTRVEASWGTKPYQR